MGAANTPAYRGTAYVVFEELPLERFGNRLPQLSFEVFRPILDGESAESLVRAVTLIPASGEFAYATEVVRREIGETTSPENVNAEAHAADIVVALDRLQACAPNVESVSLVVAWFGDDLRAGHCRIRPGVEVSAKTTTPANWSVNGVEPRPAHLVSRDAQNRPAYGGTPSDSAVVQAIQELKARGYRVTFYPFILMDVPADNDAAGPVLGRRRGDRPAGLSLARAHHLLAGGGLRRQRRQDRGRGHAGRRLLRRRRSRPTSTSTTSGSSGTAIRTTGACGG